MRMNPTPEKLLHGWIQIAKTNKQPAPAIEFNRKGAQQLKNNDLYPVNTP